MKKNKLFTLMLAFVFVFSLFFTACEEDVKPEPDEVVMAGISAAELVANIGVGWNLGNTLDAHPGSSNSPANNPWATNSPQVMEARWGNQITRPESIDALRSEGFNAIRIPVTWYKAVDTSYNIREDWMERVKEIVDYAVSNDMYIFLNTHHDESIFKLMDNEIEESKTALQKIWQQIAETFKPYDEKLVFEGLNEPRTIGSSQQWNGGTPEERNNLNILNQLFVDTVRASGGNNTQRVLMIPTYAASATPIAMTELTIPEDSAENRIIVSIHAYVPNSFALFPRGTSTWSRNNTSDTNPINEVIDRADSLFVSKGIPVIMGEFGALNKENEDVRAEYSEYYVKYAKSKGIKCIWWDNGAITAGSEELFGIFNRRTNVFPFPKIIEALMRGIE